MVLHHLHCTSLEATRHVIASTRLPHASSSCVGLKSCRQLSNTHAAHSRLSTRTFINAAVSVTLPSWSSGTRVPSTIAQAASIWPVCATSALSRAPPHATHLLLAAVEARHQQRAAVLAHSKAAQRVRDLRTDGSARAAAVHALASGRTWLVGDVLKTSSLCSVCVVSRPAACAASALCAARCSRKGSAICDTRRRTQSARRRQREAQRSAEVM